MRSRYLTISMAAVGNNHYVQSFPDLMQEKKVMYVHGFASSGQSGTVASLRQLLPSATIIAPDLPIHPEEALELLKRICREEQPDLIIGTSMGGMYAELLRGYDRILVNPAFQMGETISKHGMLGKVTFLNPRQDGVQEFIMTKQLQAEYQAMTECCFQGVEEETAQVYGLFGLEDPLVHTYGLFFSHYPNALHFHGEHRLNDSILLHSVIPVVRWIDDQQSKRQRNIVYISIEQTMERNGTPLPSLLKAYRLLLEHYDVFVVGALPANDTTNAARLQQWAFETLGVAVWNRLIFTNRKDLLYGDYLIDSLETNGSLSFMSTRIAFGTDAFKTWDDVITYFERLGGQ